jgi:N-acetylneuraminic acid mutarotase
MSLKPNMILPLRLASATLVLGLFVGQAAMAGSFVTTALMSAERSGHTATLLSDGKVIVAGGTAHDSGVYLSSTELFDPSSETWATTNSLNITRAYHTATLLPNGKVLVAGGLNNVAYALSSAEVFDPATGLWSWAPSMNQKRFSHTATLLPTGKLLVAGGKDLWQAQSVTELYDPAAGTWTVTAPLNTARASHTATLLRNGKVLVVGGANLVGLETIYLSTAELYDPASGTWAPTGSLNTARGDHTATLLSNGKVMVAGGYNSTNLHLASAELYDPVAGTWTMTGRLTSTLSSGKVLLAGGNSCSTSTSSDCALTELYDPVVGTWTMTAPLNTARMSHTATLLGNGKVLVAGGCGFLAAELYDPAAGAWTPGGPLGNARQNHTATLLGSGKVLVAGGSIGNSSQSFSLSSAELYDPAIATWTVTSSLNKSRCHHTASLLPNGKVLVAGGADFTNSNNLASAELYDPATGAWTPANSLIVGVSYHTATLLPNGKVLVVGTGNYIQPGEQLYDPAIGTWTLASMLTTARNSHTATLLPNGKVLVAGGRGFAGPGGNALSSAEVYDPTTGTWTPTASLLNARYSHTATLLPNGKVLVSGGYDATHIDPAGTELYDPTNGTWVATGMMNNAFGASLTATLLPNGKVLAGGWLSYLSTSTDRYLSNMEVYDPATGTWKETGTLNNCRSGHTATLLSSGKVLAVGGEGLSGFLTSTEIYETAPVLPVLPFILTNAMMLKDGSFQFTFTNTPGASFTALSSTNVAQPLTTWTPVSGLREVSPGRFQVTDAQATNYSRRFYRVRSP